MIDFLISLKFFSRNFIGSCKRIEKLTVQLLLLPIVMSSMLYVMSICLWIFSKNNKKLFVLIMSHYKKLIRNKEDFRFYN